MSELRITKEFSFEGAHALVGYNGKCRHIHGHSYKLLITVTGTPSSQEDDPKNGMIIDFSDLKLLVQKHILDFFDHALLLREDAPLANELAAAYNNVRILDFQPTCENMVCHIAHTLEAVLPSPARLYCVRLYETSTSYAEWTKK